MHSHINALTLTAMRLNYCFKETFNLLATRAGGFEQELPGIDQELTEIFFLFKQQLHFFKQQLSAIRSQCERKNPRDLARLRAG